ncbi:hypothetical protein [Haloarcula sp. Atlit-7R]|uniref:hypothetical protein n=1 Tax=Haloarcula sp. Atlit-7R TaxID=2282125 RepID=UPI0011C34B19|nr:hypothetical protein [Haloarcula sp. Atlit-7R]
MPRTDEPVATIVRALDEEDTALNWSTLTNYEQEILLDILVEDDTLENLISIRDEMEKTFDQMDAPCYIENQMFFGAQMIQELICSYIIVTASESDAVDLGTT